ncbi:MAG: cytochrome c [Deltaproteobacteria bacterium]|nr:MAG: cytochrome c [Deltaproteobacteria bacterium]
MLRQISIIVLGGLVSCSGSAHQQPRVAGDQSKTTELGLFMKTRVNPSFSKISFLLFHEEDSETDVDPTALPASAAELARAAERLTKWPELPGESEQSKLVFTEYADSLRSDAVKLVEALHGNQRDSARKVFESLHRKCDACHHFFRYDQSSVLDQRGQGNGPRP